MALHMTQFYGIAYDAVLWHCIWRSSMALHLTQFYGIAFDAVPMALHMMQFLWHCVWRSSYGIAYDAVPMALHMTQFLCCVQLHAIRHKTTGDLTHS